jgi:hypothetical protein
LTPGNRGRGHTRVAGRRDAPANNAGSADGASARKRAPAPPLTRAPIGRSERNAEMKHILVLCAAILVGGCSAVYSPVPVGDKPTNIERAQTEWEGTWMHTDGAMTVKVMDGSNGVLKVGWIQDEQGDLKHETASVFLRDGGGWTFASIKPQGETNENRYTWARIEKKERLAILWGPDVKKFKTLVRDGMIPGKVDGSDVVLGSLASNHLALITSETNGVLFNWDEPFVLIKSGK